MPWTPKQFAARHNHGLRSPHAKQVAAKVANALIGKGEPEGKAIRIANAAGNRAAAKVHHR